jgi:hypothetical protein
MRPRRSKAWIIVLIVVIILVAVAYSLFTNREQIFGAKNAEKITKTFSPLLGSSKKPETVDPGNTTGTNTNTEGVDETPTDTTSGEFGNGDGFNTGDGLGVGEGFGNTGGSGTRNDQVGTNYTPPLSPLPTPGSGVGGSGGGTTIVTDPTPVPPIRVNPPNPNFCPEDPLVFTDAEKEELATLLRQYYLIAPTIKTTDDLALVNNDISINQALLDQATTLTNQCTAQKSSFGYGGPQITKDNPYYDDPTNTNTVPYISTFSQLEEIFKIW